MTLEASADAGHSELALVETEIEHGLVLVFAALEQRANTQFDAAEAAIEHLSAAATEITDQLIAAFLAIEHGLDEAQSSASTALSDAGAVLLETLHAVEAVDQQRSHDMDGLKQACVQITADLDAFSNQVRQLTDQALHRAQEMASGFDATGQALTADQQRTVATVESLRHLFDERLQGMTVAMQTLGHAVQVGVRDLETAGDQLAQSAAQTIEQAIAHNIQAMGGGIDEIDTAMALLFQLGEAVDSNFGRQLDEVLHLVKQVSDLIEAIRPVLELASSIG